MINYDDIKVGDTYKSTTDKRMVVKILSVSNEVVNTGYNTYAKVAEVEQLFGGNVPSRRTMMQAWEDYDGKYYFRTIMSK